MKKVIYNGNVILPDRILKNACILVERNRIVDVFKKPEVYVEGAEYIDAKGHYISPGFIDAHLHGGGGYVMSGNESDIIRMASTHIKYGLTSMLPTTVAASDERTLKAIEAISRAKENVDNRGARILGIHLEGPYFSMKYKGAQNPSFIKEPMRNHYEMLIDSSPYIVRVSAAPELKGAMEMGQYLRERGILVSVAHSDADYPVMLEAAQNGFSHITHMYNGMSGLKSPDYYMRAGVIECGLLMDEYDVEVIADGKHVPPEMLHLLYKCKGPEKMMLTTDAMSIASDSSSSLKLGEQDIIIDDDVAMLADRSSFAGSVATADRLLRTAYISAGLPLHASVRMLSLTPARVLGMDSELGSLEKGKLADILIFDKDINIKTVMLAGEIII